MQTDAYTIQEFCQAHRLSRSSFYNLKSQGKAPRTFRVGAKVLVSREAAEKWRREMELASEATA